ncbi:MAG: PKD domain-containing protein [Thermoplasmatota archaeon]
MIPVEVPDAPDGFTIDQAASALQLAWQRPAGDATTYNVYRGETSDHMALYQDRIVGLAYEDTNVTRGVLYYYAVSATNVRGEGAWSDIVPAGLIVPPSKPLNLLVAGYPGKVSLAWLPPLDKGGSPNLRYYINRTSASGNDGIIATDLTATHYIDTNVSLNPLVTYTYTVTAFNPLTSEPSTARSAAPKPLENHLPIAALAVESTNIDNGATATFDGSGSTDSDGRVVAFEFDYGDNTPTKWTKQPTTSHIYALGNTTYTVRLRVMDDRGGISLWPANVTIVVGHDPRANAGPDTGAPNQPPIAPTTTAPPGTKTPGKIPGPGADIVLVALAGVAMLGTRRRRR